MKTRLLKRLRKEAEEKIFVSHSDGKYYVMNAEDYVYHDGRYIKCSSDKEFILSFCDLIRREYIMKHINLMKKNKRIN